jgi:hypothetical protein
MTQEYTARSLAFSFGISYRVISSADI